MNNSNIKTAIMEMLMARIHSNNTGDPYRPAVRPRDMFEMHQRKIRIEGDTVTENGTVIYTIERRCAKKKVNGYYKELKPVLKAVTV